MFLGVYGIAATVLWVAARCLAPAGTKVPYRRVAFAVALMLPLDFVIRFVTNRFLGGSGDSIIALCVDTMIVVFVVGMPIWRSLLATFAYYWTLVGCWVVVALTFGRS